MRRFAALAISAFVFLAALKVADIAFGHVVQRSAGSSHVEATPRSIVLRERPPNMDVMVRPDKAYLAITQDLPDRPYRLRTDANGFVVGGNEAPGEIDLVFVGGSTTESVFVDEEKRFPAAVSRLLQRKDGKPAQTRNAAMSGNHSLHSTFSVLAKVVPLKPRYVVIMENINDLSILTNTGSYWRAPESRAIVQGDGARHGWGKSLKDFFLPNMWPYVRSVVPKAARPQSDEYAEFRASAGKVPLERMKQDFRASLVTAIETLRAWNIKPVLMTQFNRIEAQDEFVRSTYAVHAVKVPYEELVRSYKEFNQAIRDVARERAVPLIDLAARVPPDKSSLYDAVHLNEAGSRRVARLIAGQLVALDQSYRLSE